MQSLQRLLCTGAAATGTLVDVGCGPGATTAHLVALGHDAHGVDLSPGMIAVARASWPGIRFEVGTMEALDTDAACRAPTCSRASLNRLDS
jgi:trans-aconitate methyltransferase